MLKKIVKFPPFYFALGILALQACTKENGVFLNISKPTQTHSERIGTDIFASFNTGRTLHFKVLNQSAVVALCRNPSGEPYVGELHIPDSILCDQVSYPVVEIQDSAFFNNSKLNSIRLPESLKRIGNYAFAYTSIKELTIPKNVEWLGENAFKQDEYTMISVHLKPLNPPKQAPTKLLLVFHPSTKIFVPKESFDAYKIMPYIALRSDFSLFSE